MGCQYCHNKHLNVQNINIAEQEVFDYLTQNRGFLEGIVISGGEPTLQKDLGEFIKKVKALGFKVKLDTNGTNIKAVKKLMDQNLLDFVAMDIKAPFEKYKEVTYTDDDMQSIVALKDFLLNGSVDYEFRTTFINTLTIEDIITIAKSISGAKTFAIQKYRPNLAGETTHDDSEQNEAARAAGQFVGTVINRGL
jgi:pyruvate formate lyase activating enzyme